MAQLLRKDFYLHDQRYRNRVILFHAKKKVEILSTPSHLEIRVANGDRASCVAIRNLLQSEIEAIIHTTPHMSSVTVKTAFYCTRSLANSPDTAVPHLVQYPVHCSHHSTGNTTSTCTWCNECEDVIELENKHQIWFEASEYYYCLH